VVIPGRHILAGFSLGFRYRHPLADLLRTTPPGQTILELDPEQFAATGICAIALDFDGVLAPHGAAVPLPETIAWMTRCAAAIGGERMFILSNKPTDERRSWFADHFPTLRFISGVRKKPYPDGLLKTAQLADVPPAAILMVDDRLLTGCLAALHAGARPCYIRTPYASFSHAPLAETVFALLRRTERYFIRLVTLA
jgi:predicted HAD superfamily phosphohydrolase YqeG